MRGSNCNLTHCCYHVMEEEENWRQFEDLGTEFWTLIHDYFDEEDNMDWREGWRSFREEFSNLRTDYFYVPEYWD